MAIIQIIGPLGNIILVTTIASLIIYKLQVPDSLLAKILEN